MKKIELLLLCIILIVAGCVDDSVESRICHEGIVLGKIRSAGGGIAVSMTDSSFSTHRWRGHNNVIEAINIPADIYKPGEKIYFTARRASTCEQTFAISTDGDESEKPVVFVEQVSTTKCTVNI